MGFEVDISLCLLVAFYALQCVICINSELIYKELIDFILNLDIQSPFLVKLRNAPNTAEQGADCHAKVGLALLEPPANQNGWSINSDVDPVRSAFILVRGSGSRLQRRIIMKGKAEFNQVLGFFRRKLYFSSLNLKSIIIV